MSLRQRLLVGLVAVALVLVVANVVLSEMVEAHLLDAVDEQLVDVASRPVFRGGGRVGRPADRSLLPQVETFSEFFIAVGQRDNPTFTHLTSAFADSDEPPPRLEPGAIEQHRTTRSAMARPFTANAQAGEGQWRLVAIEDGRNGRIVVVGLSLGQVQSTIGRIRVIQGVGTMAALTTLALVSWWMVRLSVHPIEDMASTADAIAGGDLSRRVSHPGSGTEAGRLGIAFNAMLGRIEGAFRDRQESEDRVRQFAADASHELRTPLTTIQGYAELYRTGGLRGKRALDDAMGRIEEESRRMAALVEDLLLLARLDQLRPLERRAVRLDQIAADSVRDAIAVDPDRPIECDVEPTSVDGDEMHLRQVVTNLLTNARIHTPAGTAITVEVRVDSGSARLVVADEGPGMAPEVASRVFDRFFRAEGARGRAGGGTGLGLAIVDAVVRAHGGRASVWSEPEKGSRFVIELPASSR